MRPELFIRVNGRVIKAPEADIAVAEGYERWPDKGKLTDGRRLTIMATTRSYAVGDEVRIIHVLEVAADRPVYVSGPKPLFEEYVDGRLATAPLPSGEDPLEPASYDGPVVRGPRVDYNWDISTYRFSKPGTHQVVWKPGSLASNRLSIEVDAASLI